MNPNQRQLHGHIDLTKAISDILEHGASIEEAIFHCSGCKAAAEWIIACIPLWHQPEQPTPIPRSSCPIRK